MNTENCLWRVEHVRCVRLASRHSVSRLSRQCVILNISQPHSPPRSVTEISLLSIYADIRTSQETHLWACTVCYGDSYTFLYVHDVRTSQEKHLWASTVCCGDSYTFLYVHMSVPHRKHTYGPPRSVTGIAILSCMYICSYLTGNTPLGLHGPLPGFALRWLQKWRPGSCNMHSCSWCPSAPSCMQGI
jgi:hypothetical protein